MLVFTFDRTGRGVPRSPDGEPPWASRLFLCLLSIEQVGAFLVRPYHALPKRKILITTCGKLLGIVISSIVVRISRERIRSPRNGIWPRHLERSREISRERIRSPRKGITRILAHGGSPSSPTCPHGLRAPYGLTDFPYNSRYLVEPDGQYRVRGLFVFCRNYVCLCRVRARFSETAP